MIKYIQEHQLLVKKLAHRLKATTIHETHASSVILTAKNALKIKKPVNFGFLNFSSLQDRKKYCHGELSIASRFNPQLYQKVISIWANKKFDVFDVRKRGSNWRICEYAVLMHRFDNAYLLGKIAGKPKAIALNSYIQFINHLHDIHTKSRSVSNSKHLGFFGTYPQVGKTLRENFSQLQGLLSTDIEDSKQIFNKLLIQNKYRIARRHENNHTIQCHGDLHLGNLVYQSGAIHPFDPIEFNPDFMYLDPYNDIAFFLMDILRVNRQLGRQLLSHYLLISKGYRDSSLMTLYMCYRALVRAKISAIEKNQKLYDSYLQLFNNIQSPPCPKLILLHGLSGNGKSHLANQLLRDMHGILIQSDAIRQQLYPKDDDKYSKRATEQVYDQLLSQTKHVINARYSCIIDATFLTLQQRKKFTTFAHRHSIPTAIVQVQASNRVARDRMDQRKQDCHQYSSATWEIREKQKSEIMPVTKDECAAIFTNRELNSIKKWLQSKPQ